MERVAKCESKKIVIAHKDAKCLRGSTPPQNIRRLCRSDFDFVEWFCASYGCEIVILNNTYQPPYQELMEDFMIIMHCFSSKLYFLLKYEK